MLQTSPYRPTVSVVMCTYNGAAYIREQLDSILRQSYPVESIIIQDDGSTDGTTDIIGEYASRYPHIRLYRNTANLGFNMNFITAFARVKSELTAISDQDDIWFADKIEKQVQAIGTQYAACCTDHYRDEQYSPHCTFRRNPQNTFESQIFTSHIPGHCLLVRTSFLQSIQNWDRHIPYDWWIVINAHFHGGLTKAPYPLNWYRPYAESVATKHREKYRRHTAHPTWQPYLFGWKDLRRLQALPLWKKFYGYIYEQTSLSGEENFPAKEKQERESLQRVHQLAGLLLQNDRFSLLKLCWLCLKHRERIHSKPHPNQLMACLRGFFYPFIWAYTTTNFDY